MNSSKVISLLLFISVLGFSDSASSRPLSFDSRYDSEIESAVRKYWPDFPDWKYWKAQLYQESRLEPGAISTSGARGLAQFMPSTWADISRQLGYGMELSPHMAGPAIEAGAFYMAKLRRSWTADRTVLDRHTLALASYNAGMGSILKAQRMCGDARLWADIKLCLYSAVGIKSAETLTYVERIEEWRKELQ